MEEYN